jgi:hypothetical protein
MIEWALVGFAFVAGLVSGFWLGRFVQAYNE